MHNCQTMHSKERLMDWTVMDDISTVCSSASHSQATEKDHTPFVSAGMETTDTGVDVVKSDSRCSFLGGWVSTPGMKLPQFRSVLQPLRIPSVNCPVRRAFVFIVRLMVCCAAGTNWCQDLRCREFPSGEQLRAEWSKCQGSMAQRARGNVAPLR